MLIGRMWLRRCLISNYCAEWRGAACQQQNLKFHFRTQILSPQNPCQSQLPYGIMTADQLLYLRRAAGARREPKHNCGECAPLGEIHIQRIWYNDCRAVIIPAPSRWHPEGAKIPMRRVCIPRRDSISGGYAIMTALQSLYLRQAAGGKFPASVHTDTAGQIRRNP